MKSLDDMNEVELRDLFNSLARSIKMQLPPTTMFVLITMGTPDRQPGIGQYVSNAERGGIIKSLREMADRLEGREDVSR